MDAPHELEPIELIVLQGNSLCNLDCKYCDLSAESRRERRTMPISLLRRLFEDLFAGEHLGGDVTVVWHSGEPLSLPPSYYDEAMGLILSIGERSAKDISVRFRIQTNGVLINEQWCDLFSRWRGVLGVGISCDGPAALHDAYRVNWNGGPTHEKTVRGMDLLQAHGIPYKLIAVVTPQTLAHPRAFLEFFLARRQFLSDFHFNILAEADCVDPRFAYSTNDRDAYYAFYRALLELLREAEHAGQPFKVQNFSQTMARILAAEGKDGLGHHRHASAPLKSISVDAQGNITTFYAGLAITTLKDLYGDGRGLSIGNIHESSFDGMLRTGKLDRIIRDFRVSEQACERACPYFAICPGGYELTKQVTLGTFDASETTECKIHVQTLVDALLDDLDSHIRSDSMDAAVN